MEMTQKDGFRSADNSQGAAPWTTRPSPLAAEPFGGAMLALSLVAAHQRHGTHHFQGDSDDKSRKETGTRRGQ
jgi:hypothetical protein